ncbi:MAG: response regulator transcription factor [Phycisphaeraceae bacterium]
MQALFARAVAGMPEAVVYVVDGDAEVRRLLRHGLAAVRMRAAFYPSAEAFLESCEPGGPGCLALELALPGMSGLELQALLREQDSPLSLLVMSSFGDAETAVRVLKAGASDYVTKPFSTQMLLQRIREANAESRRRCERQRIREEAVALVDRLTRREKDVLLGLLGGQGSKQIAASLKVSERTVETRRRRIREKTGFDSLADLALLRCFAGQESCPYVARCGRHALCTRFFDGDMAGAEDLAPRFRAPKPTPARFAG